MSDVEDGRPQGNRAKIVAAASRLLREAGVDGLTTRAVAESAGVQPPAIYRLFGDKDGLIQAVAEEAMKQYVTEKRADLPPSTTDPVSGLHAAWRLHIGFGLDNPELYSLMSRRAGASTATVVDEGVDVLRTHVRRLENGGLLRVPESRAIEMIHATGHGVVLAQLEQQPADRDPDLADAVFEAVVGAITVGPELLQQAEHDMLEASIAVLAVLGSLPALSTAEKTLLTEWLKRVIEELR